MKRFVFAIAAVALVASAGAADEAPVSAPPATAPVVQGATSVPFVESVPATTAPRRGLFGRLRSRGATTTAMPVTGTVPLSTAPGTVIAPAPTTVSPAVPMPMPMPGTKTTPGATLTPTGPNGIVLTGSETVSGTVVPAAYVEPAAPRRGLFGRRVR